MWDFWFVVAASLLRSLCLVSSQIVLSQQNTRSPRRVLPIKRPIKGREWREVILDCLALLHSVIGLEKSRHHNNRSNTKLEPISTCNWSLAFSRASSRLPVFTLSFYCLMMMLTFLPIDKWWTQTIPINETKQTFPTGMRKIDIDI